MSADVVGYSRLMGADETGTIAALRAHRTEHIDGNIEAFGGRVVKTMGDGLLLEFPSVVDAVRCAIAVQEGMIKRNIDTPKDKQIVFRIGVNLGDIIVDGDDILGDGINIAARLEGLAEPGGICVSSRVHDDVRDRLDLAFTDIGERELKNISRPVQCWTWRPGAALVEQPLSTAEFVKAPTLAVLPFDNFSKDPEFEFFADGLSEDLTTLLSAYREFPVIARNSAFTFKGKEFDVMEAGKQLGANYVVEGSVRVAGKRIRVNAQLIDVNTGHHLWAQKFDGEIDDIFKLQDELCLQIAANVSPTVVRSETARVDKASSGEISQWAAMIKVRQLLVSGGRDNDAQAHEILLAQERLDPDNSMIQTLLAHRINISIVAGLLPWREARGDLLKHASRAVKLDPGNFVAYGVLSCAEQFYGHLEAALQAAERAVELNPSAGLGYVWRGICKILMGRAEESLADFAMMERLSPLDLALGFNNISKARALLNLERFDESVEFARKAVAALPNMPFNRLLLVSALALSGRAERAQQEAESFRAEFPGADMQSVLVNFKTRDPKDFERFTRGLRDAQMDIGEPGQ